MMELEGAGMGSKRFVSFAGKVIAVHTVTYFIVGAIAYNLLTKPFYTGSDPAFGDFMRTLDNPESMSHITRWFVPAQILRGILMAIVLYPFFDKLVDWNFRKRFLAISGLYIVFGYWAATVAAPGTIEGMVYMKPSITLYVHFIVQPEIITQGLALGAWLAWWMPPRQAVRATGNPACET
jgi:hypothetical protein